VPRGVISHRERGCAREYRAKRIQFKEAPDPTRACQEFHGLCTGLPRTRLVEYPSDGLHPTLFVDIVGKFLEDQKIENATLIDEGFGYVSGRLRALLELAENAQETHALFNNCYRDYGQRNAIDFQRLV
jgi:hypothetical protein